MAEVVVPGVWWLHGTRGSNVFAVATADDRLALVDTGFASSAQAILDELTSLGGAQRLSHILLTHRHIDHTAAAWTVRERTGVRTVAGRADCVPVPEGGYRLVAELGRSHVGRMVAHVAFLRPLPPLPIDQALEGEVEAAPGIDALPVPGHTPGSYCYIAHAQQVAFVGDLVISHRRGLARSMGAANADDARYLASLHAFAARTPDIGCPGHGRPMIGGFAAALRRLAGRPRRPVSTATVLDRAIRMQDFAQNLLRRRTS
jgi:glyoxylase-like metal-dependent hydrolase (beta-lactamase superfamily II)